MSVPPSDAPMDRSQSAQPEHVPSYPQPASLPGQPLAPQQHVYMQQPPVIVVNQASGPGCLVRGLWFVCIGLWLGLFVTGFAWLLVVSVIGLPIGLALLNRLPQMMTLKPAATQTTVSYQNGAMVIGQANEQRPFWIRALYFVLVGWWASGLWLGLAWLLVGTIIGMPIAFTMFNSVPAVTTLRK